MRSKGSFLRLRRLAWWVLSSVLVLAVLVAADWFSALPPTAKAQYVGRNSCVQCHAPQVDQWHGSHHDRAMELASEESVLGDFGDSSFTRLGVTTKFFRRDDKYWVNTEGSDGELHDYEVRYTFGIEPLQQYMVEMPDGRVQVLRVSWDTINNEWFYVVPTDVAGERIEPGDPLHWTGVGQNWNTMCAECHSTNVHKNYDLATNTYKTTFSEIDVSCETCHGPASLHVELAKSKSLFWDRRLGYGLHKLKGATSAEQLETCAPCHSRRSQIHPDYHAGKEFFDFFEPALLSEGLYHADGQINDEVYVYGSFLQSKMHAKGVRCTDCHNPHSLELKFEGNRLCAQCHQPGKYDSPTHHHHSDPTGTQCVNCHMPSKNYMVIDRRRDHSFRIPRPDLSEQLGTPNACNQCHTKPEESAAWAANAVREWYGEQSQKKPHYATAIAAGQRGDPEGLELLSELLEKRDTPAIVRATAMELLANYGPMSKSLARKAAKDTSPLVRAAAAKTLNSKVLQDLLMDSIRLVRMLAARQLANGNWRQIEQKFREDFDRGLAEYRQAQQMFQERAAAQLNLAALSSALGNLLAAQKSLQTAMRLEPYFLGIRDNLAALLAETGGNSDNIRKLREQEAKLIERSYKLLPDNADLRFRRGILLYQLDKLDEAGQAFEAACKIAPDVYQYWLVLTEVYEKQQRWPQAVEAFKEVHRLGPEEPDTVNLFERLQQAMSKQK